jgi:hypothetical protein
MTGVCAFETFEARRESTTLSGRNRPRPWTEQMGGKRAYQGHRVKGRSPRQSHLSIASAK